LMHPQQKLDAQELKRCFLIEYFSELIQFDITIN
jgi:hypothetical protein